MHVVQLFMSFVLIFKENSLTTENRNIFALGGSLTPKTSLTHTPTDLIPELFLLFINQSLQSFDLLVNSGFRE